MADMHTPLRIAEVMKEEAENGAACGWQSCTGCHETSEGAETGHYPYSETFGCYVGSGCGECGGLGVVWLYYSRADLDDMASETAAPAPSQDAETVKALEAQIATKDAALKVALMWSDDDWVGHEIVTAALAGSAS